MKPENFISVMLYEVDQTYTDSTVFQSTPTYVTNTLDSASTFELSNLKAGTYQLVALKDNNNNYKYDPNKEKIGFLEKKIQLPTDSSYVLNLFREVPQINFMRPNQQASQHFLFGYEGEIDLDSLDISLISSPPNFEHRITKDPEKDTLHYFFKPQINRDTLRFAVSHKEFRDTLSLRLRDSKKDSLQVNILPTGNLNFRDTLKIRANIPIETIETSFFSLINKDSLPVAFTPILINKRDIIFKFEKEENQQYILSAYPGAIRDFFGATNDSISNSLRTRTYGDYGNLAVNLQNLPDPPIIVQLTTEKGAIKGEKIGEDQSVFNFENLSPGKYLLRVVIDENNNGKWDTGNFLEKRQPETIIYFPEVIDIRANWDISQTFILR